MCTVWNYGPHYPNSKILEPPPNSHFAGAATDLWFCNFFLFCFCQCPQYTLVSPVYFVRFLADHTSLVCLSVTLCIVAKQYILLQMFLNKWIGNVLLGTWWYNFQPPIIHWPRTLKLPATKICKAVQRRKHMLCGVWYIMQCLRFSGFLRHCAIYKFTYLFIYLLIYAYVTHMQIRWCCLYSILAPTISTAVRSAISATAGLLVCVYVLKLQLGYWVKLQLQSGQVRWLHRIYFHPMLSVLRV